MEEALLAQSDDVSERYQSKKINPLTGFQIRVMLVLCFVNFCSCTGFTLLTTFFPHESMEKRGITSTQNSLIFAVYALINIFACPFFGYFLPTIGARTMLLIGIAVSAIGALLFSFLHLEMDPLRFVIFACITRVIQAFACSMYLTAAYSIMTHVWSERRTQAVGLLEMTTGCGMVIGPMVGSALYNASGFALPFIFLFAILLLGFFPTAWVLRNLDMKTSGKSTAITNSIMLSSRLYSGDFTEQLTLRQFCSIFTNPGTYATILLTILCWSAMDFVMPGLQVHVSLMYPQLNTNEITTRTGILFVVFAIAYAIGTPVVGKLCTVWGHKSARPCMISGAVLIVLSYLFIGPQEQLANWTGLATLGLNGTYLGGAVHVGVMFFFLGTGLALVAVPSVEDMVQCCFKVGLPREGIATVAVVSGFYNCILFVGEFVGPMVQGLITDWLIADPVLTKIQRTSQMYFWWSVICAAITVVAGTIYLAEYLYERYRKPTRSIRSPRKQPNEEHLEEQRGMLKSPSAVFGPQSFTMSMSQKYRNRRRNASSNCRKTLIE